MTTRQPHGGTSAHVERAALYVFLFLLLFSNLFGRVIGVNVNLLLYLAFVLVLIPSLVHFPPDLLTRVTTLVATFYLLYVLDFRSAPFANLLAVKDFVLPILCIPIGYRLFHYKTKVVRSLAVLFLPFVAYGVVQQLSFYAGVLDEVLPWDAAWVAELRHRGVRNLYQGQLLRFFGTMNAFVEYQIYVAFLVSFLWLNRALIAGRCLIILNCGLAGVFLGSAFERSPLLMLAILLLVWKSASILSSVPRTVTGAVVVGLVLALLSFAFAERLKNSPLFEEAYARLANIVTLNFREDDAITERIKVQWSKSRALIAENPFGIGPGRVAPGAEAYEGSIQPHNNYLAYYLAYGLWGLLVLLTLLAVLARRLLDMDKDTRLFGYGVLVSYCAMALFNLPFAGKAGMLFFLILGFFARGGTAEAR